MLTPQEIAEVKFDKVMVWGYDMNGVDSFMETVEADYAQLYKENITLKNKMKVLVAKIEEYRAVDESMRKALLAAQNMAAEIVEKARQETQSREAELQSREAAIEEMLEARREELNQKLAAEEMRLEEARTSAQVFIDRILSMYSREQELLTSIREREFGTREKEAVQTAMESTGHLPPIAPQEPVAAAAEEEEPLPDTVPLPNVEQAVSEQATIAMKPAATRVYEVEPEAAPAPRKRFGKKAADDEEEAIAMSQKPRFEFNDLQFGNQYKSGKK
ncbi:MAG: DivIVA domain-containing protein [Ruminococcaceae bacterium]|nr:DivIVA domain-containing protein [Oscillospiraceae bacterium]